MHPVHVRALGPCGPLGSIGTLWDLDNLGLRPFWALAHLGPGAFVLQVHLGTGQQLPPLPLPGGLPGELVLDSVHLR